MKKAIILISTILVILMTACACTKDNIEKELTPITQTGANTFGLLYNGVVFNPTDSNSRGFGAGGSALGLNVRRGFIGAEPNSVKIEADRYTNIKNVLFIDLYIYKLDSIGLGTYTLGGFSSREGWREPYNSYIVMYAKSPTTGKRLGYQSYENSGEIIITRHDEDLVVFSGTFNGKLKSSDGTETVEISQGRFDIDYSTYRDKEYN